MRIKALSAALLFGIAACGGDQPADQPPATQDPVEQAPAEAADVDWFQVDEDAQTVTIELIAGSTSANNHWNYNGLHGGAGEITVPEGFTVTINFSNQDPGMAHSVGIGEAQATYPASYTSPTPVFEGGMSSNPTSMTDSTMPGESETITFVAETAGEYALICYVTGHAANGMILPFIVSDDGSHGVRM
jgi:FtsP/CotA-like multicopper oxidase with cupredoxin domain